MAISPEFKEEHPAENLPEETLAHTPVFNEDLWVYLLTKINRLNRSQLRKLMHAYQPDNPQPIAELWKQADMKVALPQGDLMLEKCAFDYTNQTEPYEAALHDLNALYAFGSLSLSSVTANGTLEDYDLEEFFSPSVFATEIIAKLTNRLLHRAVKGLNGKSWLKDGHYRILAASALNRRPVVQRYESTASIPQ